ncbi:MAG: BA14K family protein [Candidatus Kaistia colombiensis]|nr:MAG: BA14K family protein [Kaistia sp.]
MVLSRISSAAMALVFAASAWPAQAAPLMRVDPGASTASNVIQVQGRPCPPQGCRPGDGPGRPNQGGPGRPGPSSPSWGGPGHGGPNRPGPSKPSWGGPSHGGPNWNRPNNNRPGYWNGHHGYNGPRDGYRRHSDGYWYPLAAFGVGALIGGMIANQPREVAPPSLSRDHLRWCEDRYRSFRASDNSFQPNNGPRQACVSPYY